MCSIYRTDLLICVQFLGNYLLVVFYKPDRLRTSFTLQSAMSITIALNWLLN